MSFLSIQRSVDFHFDENPFNVWESIKDRPLSFESSIQGRIKHIAEVEPKYRELVERRKNKLPLTTEEAHSIVFLEHDPLLNLVRKELQAADAFEKISLADLSEPLQQTYFQGFKTLKKFSSNYLQTRNELFYLLGPGKISLLDARLLLETWKNYFDLNSKKTDSLISALSGTRYQISNKEDINTQGSSLMILTKAIENLEFKKDDIALEIQAGLARISFGAAILFPEFRFIALENDFQKYNYAQYASKTFGLSNFQIIDKDTLVKLDEHTSLDQLKKIRLFYTFENLNSLKKELISEEIKILCKLTGQSKYLVLGAQQEYDTSGKLGEYSAIKIEP